jgi:thioredoxin reductase (NADPH)
MVTTEEIAAVPLFAGLSAAERERLSRACADISIGAGEYAVQEGDERALFAVLEGRIEVVKLVEGIERVLGERLPGAIFGEVPITLGMPFPSGFRAAEASRIMRIATQDYYALAASAPEVALKVGTLARQRIGGLQGVAAEPPQPRALVVGDGWDAACSEIRRFLDRNQITFRWLTPDAAHADGRLGGGLVEGRYPVIRAADGTTLVQPSPSEVAELLGLQTHASNGEYDTVIIGGGPAGLAAAVYGASEGLRTIVIEREAPGGQAGTSSRIENYLGFPSGISGDELSSRALRQARRLGAEILVTRSITGIDPPSRQVILDDGDVLLARTIIIATGVA